MPLNQQCVQAGLVHFDAWWQLQLPWLEAPNEERGGWSGVSLLPLDSASDASHMLYVKRQQNHTRRTWRHPILGVPTFALEFEALKQLQALGIAVPHVVFFAASKEGNTQQAVLVTQALAGCVSLDQLSPSMLDATEQARLAQLLGSSLRVFHRARWQHRAMYPKHIFVPYVASQGIDRHCQQCAFIDLEKARPMWWPFVQQFTDLIPLFVRLQRGEHAWSEAWLKSVYSHYCGKSATSWVHRWAWSRIERHLHQRHC